MVAGFTYGNILVPHEVYRVACTYYSEARYTVARALLILGLLHHRMQYDVLAVPSSCRGTCIVFTLADAVAKHFALCCRCAVSMLSMSCCAQAISAVYSAGFVPFPRATRWMS